MLPAAAVIEMALAAARQRFPDAPALEVRDLEIRRPLPLEVARAREISFRLQPESGHFDLLSRARLSGEAWSHHAVGRIAAAEPLPLPNRRDEPVLRMLEPAPLYRFAEALGLHYGPAFRQMQSVEILAEGRAAVRLAPPQDGPEFLLDPRQLDGVFQGLLGLLAEAAPRDPDGSVLAALALRRRAAAAAGPVRLAGASLELRRATRRAACADIVLRDEAGRPVALLQGLLVPRRRGWRGRRRSRTAPSMSSASRYPLAPCRLAPHCLSRCGPARRRKRRASPARSPCWSRRWPPPPPIAAWRVWCRRTMISRSTR